MPIQRVVLKQALKPNRRRLFAVGGRITPHVLLRGGGWWGWSRLWLLLPPAVLSTARRRLMRLPTALALPAAAMIATALRLTLPAALAPGALRRVLPRCGFVVAGSRS